MPGAYDISDFEDDNTLHEKLLKLHDKAYEAGMVTREQAADDMVFALITQWDDNLLGESQLLYRGEFDMLHKAIRQTVAELYANPITVDFEPKSRKDKSGAEIADGMYRTDMSTNESQQAKLNAIQETVICGV